MKYWSVIVFDSSKGKEATFNMSAPKLYNAKKLRDILKSIHPEFEKIKFKLSKRPSNCITFMDAEKPKKETIDTQEHEGIPMRNIGFAS